jgi:nitrous oxidase accessory protein NosD
MKRRVAVMLGVALAAVGLSMGPARAATVLVVDNDTILGACDAGAADHATIQDAVAVAIPGDLIRVCPGTYHETVTVPVEKHDLTFEGAKVGIDARTRSQRGESIITSDSPGGVVRLLADGVVWDGFLINDNLQGPGMYTSPRASEYVIRNTVFNDNGLGLYLNTSGEVLTRVRHNRFTANNEFENRIAGNGIYSDQGASCILIADNLFERHNGAGILFADSGKPQHCVDVVHNESIDDRTFAAFFASSHVRVISNTVQSERGDDEPGSAIFIGARNNGVIVKRNHIKSTDGNGIDVRNTAGPRRPAAPPRDVDIRWNTVRHAKLNGIDVAASGVEEYVVRVNTAVDNEGVGVHAGPKTDGTVFAYNIALDNGLDCQDESVGRRTAGTNNTWRFNVGRTSEPDGICQPNQPKPKPSKPKPPKPKPKPCYPWRN